MSTFENSHRPIGAEQIFALEAQIVKQAQAFGVRMNISSEALFAHFKTVAPARLEAVYKSLTELKSAFDLCAEEGVDVWDDTEFFRLSMSSLGLSYPRSFVEQIREGDIIEGYDLESRQIFRNMRFMEVSSYSLTEIMGYDWQVLFDRAPEITKQIMNSIQRSVMIEKRLVQADVPKHLIRELRSSQPQAAEIEFRMFAPLYSGPEMPTGFLSVCRGKLLNSEITVSRENVAFL